MSSDQSVTRVLESGVYPAAVTPFTAKNEVDSASLARLLAYFEAAGCKGVVLAGTNGEGPSLSAVEKRDLARLSTALRGNLQTILGIATPSLPEAQWLAKCAANFGCAAVLVMPPGYFRQAPADGIIEWFESVMNSSPVPVLVYNYPKMTGITIPSEMMGRLAQHPNFGGLKDSSGERANLEAYRGALAEHHVLFTGDERILIEALTLGWTGTISGAANVLPQWLSRVVSEWNDPEWRASALTKFELILPIIETIRNGMQPNGNKAVLERFDVLDSRRVRRPLMDANDDSITALLEQIEDRLGIRPGALGLPG